MDDTFDPYAELQLSPDAEPELVKAAFKALAKKYHPDRFTDPAEKKRAEARMARINEAQDLIQSGKYRPPPPEAPLRPEPPPPPPPQATSPNPSRKPKAEPPVRAKPIPTAPFVIAALFFVAITVLPGAFSSNHLNKALELERQGQYQESLEELNAAVEKTPHNRELYRHRARLWQKLGKPERAAVDLKNAETPGPSSMESEPDQVPNRPVEKSPSDVP